MEKTEVPYVEMPATNGPVILIDKEDYDKLPTKNWRIHQKGKTACVITYDTGLGKSAVFLTKVLVAYNSKQRVIFRNGNRLDHRRLNLMIAKKNGQGTNKEKRSKAPETLELNGCILRKAGLGNRCYPDKELCPYYSECLDAVCKRTVWRGWTAEKIVDQGQCSKESTYREPQAQAETRLHSSLILPEVFTQ